MTIEKALDEVAKEYAKALRLDYVWNPLAWALYRVWRKADADPKNKRRTSHDTD